jgi:hypothetical protein
MRKRVQYENLFQGFQNENMKVKQGFRIYYLVYCNYTRADALKNLVISIS